MNPKGQAERQVRALIKAASGHALRNGFNLCADIEDASKPILEWLHYLLTSEDKGIATELLHGTHAAILEVAGSVGLGLVRPAIFAIRSQVDMLLSWIYFKDHPVEWRDLSMTGFGFMTKTDVFKYLGDHVQRFKERFAVLKQAKLRTEDDPYQMLSAHVHGQSALTVPNITSLPELVNSRLCDDCVQIQSDVSEYMSDILLVCCVAKWASLPAVIIQKAEKRLTEDQRRILFM